MTKISWFKLIVISAMVGALMISMSSACLAKGSAKKGKRLYNQYCTPCHGKNGKGDGTRAKVEKLDPQPRNHTDGKYMNKRTNLQLFKTITNGGKSMNFSHIMPQWKHIFKEKDFWNIIAHVRGLAEPAWTGKPDPPDKK